MHQPAPLRPLVFADLAGWPQDDHLAAFVAFRRCARHASVKSYRTGAFGLAHADFAESYAVALTAGIETAAEARRFFESHFRPFGIAADGFVTGFYEPTIAASRRPGPDYPYPIYRRPSDLVAIGDHGAPSGWDPEMAFARDAEGGLVAYFDRAQIEGGALAGRGLELAWAADRVDLFFGHVQGAARLALDDGGTVRVTYDGKSGHAFTGPGGVLAGLGEIAREKVTMQSIRAWLAANPARIDEILHRNRSFIFFREAEVDDAALGPIAAAKVPLAAGRSLAVDRLLHTFSTPVFVDAPQVEGFGTAFRRLMIVQDTGSAIVGPARGDIFCGSGAAAGEIAGVIRNRADFTLLVPLQAAGRLA